jgi:hypothetical protein
MRLAAQAEHQALEERPSAGAREGEAQPSV